MANKEAAKAPSTPRRPTAEQLRRELERMDKKRGMPTVLKVLLFLLVIVLIAGITFFCLLSGYVIYGDSMSPTLEEKDLVLAIPKAKISAGDMVAFRHEDRILIKRAVGAPGDQIEVTDDGHVRLNGYDLYEPYAMFSNSGANDMTYPLDVPEHSWFVLGDNRGSSVDSRSSILGLIDEDRILGKVFIRVWPLPEFRLFDKAFFPQLVDALLPG